jgi:hypothetical protein
MRKLLYTAAAAAALTLGSTVANAAVIVTAPSPAVYTPPTSGGLIGQVAAGTSSNDTFNFTITGSPALFSGQLSTTSLLPNGAGNINFSNILLDGMAGLFSLITAPGAAETQACCQPLGNGTVLLGTGSHTLSFTATNTSNVLGTYSGTFNFGAVPAAVPEPATWGMMLFGFAGIGMAIRRRRRPVLAQIA